MSLSRSISVNNANTKHVTWLYIFALTSTNKNVLIKRLACQRNKSNGKGKGKDQPRTGHEGPEVEV
jgi:hypothetical protein